MSELDQPVGVSVFHVTHWKAGSSWIRKILLASVPGRVAPRAPAKELFSGRLEPGTVYAAVYATQDEFEAAPLPPEWTRFVVLRDLRDTLVSGYFSFRFSHRSAPHVDPLRKRLEPLGEEDGIRLVLDDFLPKCARIQSSWLDAGEPFIRFEDLLRDDIGTLEPVLLESCRLPTSSQRLRTAIRKNRFRRLTGRARGSEDRMAHARRGVEGDWRNHFTPKIEQEFKERFGGLLVTAGYERDTEW